ncbi:MAG: hypothetical protein RLP09_39525, partial [Sandaracinaceae bacterium]
TSCPSGQVDCGGRCVDPNTDPIRCGASGTCTGPDAGATCMSGQVCAAGSCETRCPSGQVDCGGRCVDPSTDPIFCGASGDCAGPNMGAVCASGEACSAGVCELRCPGGQIICGGRCVDPSSDRVYCGAAGDCTGVNDGVTCSAGQVCAAGSCELSCPAGQIDCGGRCVDPDTNRAFCGASGDCSGANVGVTCGAGETCAMGACTASCGAPLTDCSGSCTDTRVDPSNCGGCGAACPGVTNATSVCATSTCNYVCDSGFADCNVSSADGCEVDVAGDVSNCGGCGVTCPGATNASAACAMGACDITCDAGFDDCNGMPGDGCEADLGSDAANCGGCGVVCAAGCTMGVCDPGGSDGRLDVTAPLVINTVATNLDGSAGGSTATLVDATGFADGDLVFIHQTVGAGAGAWETARILSLMGTTATFEAALSNTYTSAGANRAQIVVMPEYTDVAVAAAGVLRAPAWDGSVGGILAFDATGAVTVDGRIEMSGRGFRGGNVPGGRYTCRVGYQGESSLGGGGPTQAANGAGGGGGRQGQDCGAGGGGGYAAGGGTGTASSCGACCAGSATSAGGSGVGDAVLTTLFLGGGGGSGGADEDGFRPGPGGSGGGIVYITTDTFDVSGTGQVLNAGGGGTDGQQACPGCGGCGMGGGGGGAGGAVLIRAAGAVDLGVGRVSATGATGGVCTCGGAAPGGTGSVGRIRVVGASVMGSTTPAYVP